MYRTPRAVFLTLFVATAIAACKKKPEVAPEPAAAPAPTETCNQACRDSIARDEEARKRAADEAARRSAADEEARRVASVKATLANKVFFEYDASELSADARAALDAKLPILRANPQMRLRISGHADERGSDEYNLALGQRRAAAVKRYLSDQGIDQSRLDIVTFGEERPAVEGASEDAFRQNRRAEFEVTAGGDNIVVPK
jgi:peptidoglycan-associated lipoprotein